VTWTVLSLIQWAEQYFSRHAIESPRFTAERLLAFVLKQNRLFLYLHHDAPLTAEELAAFKACLHRRIQGEPTQYILGTAGFMGLDFQVTPDVLIPRPETETLARTVIDWLNRTGAPPPMILDAGTGSGCIAVAIAKYVPGIHVFASDFSAEALTVAQKNADTHQVAISFQQGNWLEPFIASLQEESVFIVSNPPYIAESEKAQLQTEVKDFEPHAALFANNNGLAAYQEIIAQSRSFNQLAGMAFEVGLGQAAQVQTYLHATYPSAKVQISSDLNSIERIVFMSYNS